MYQYHFWKQTNNFLQNPSLAQNRRAPLLTRLSEENMTSAVSSSSPLPLFADSKMLAKNPPKMLPTLPSEAPPPPSTAFMSEASSRDWNF